MGLSGLVFEIWPLDGQQTDGPTIASIAYLAVKGTSNKTMGSVAWSRDLANSYVQVRIGLLWRLSTCNAVDWCGVEQLQLKSKYTAILYSQLAYDCYYFVITPVIKRKRSCRDSMSYGACVIDVICYPFSVIVYVRRWTCSVTRTEPESSIICARPSCSTKTKSVNSRKE